jgi:hypothetical protein
MLTLPTSVRVYLARCVREFAASRGFAPATMYWWRCWLRERPATLVPVAVVDRGVKGKRPTDLTAAA